MSNHPGTATHPKHMAKIYFLARVPSAIKNTLLHFMWLFHRVNVYEKTHKQLAQFLLLSKRLIHFERQPSAGRDKYDTKWHVLPHSRHITIGIYQIFQDESGRTRNTNGAGWN
jgi:hypothetical protein